MTAKLGHYRPPRSNLKSAISNRRVARAQRRDDLLKGIADCACEAKQKLEQEASSPDFQFPFSNFQFPVPLQVLQLAGF
jgi:hypothetical protein